MNTSKKIIAIIPARGGSKSILRKNIKLLAGKPMIAYCIEAVRAIKQLDRIIVSTDDREIAEVAQSYGAEIPFFRPAELATDEITTLPVVQHVLQYLAKEEKFIPDYVLLIYPTSPLLRSTRIQEAINLAYTTDADSIVSGTYDTHHYWYKRGENWERFYPLEIANRQLIAPLFKENGALYLSKTHILKNQIVADHIVPLIMEPGENIDVDTIQDFEEVEEKMHELKQ